jgi:hypothetical protein
MSHAVVLKFQIRSFDEVHFVSKKFTDYGFTREDAKKCSNVMATNHLFVEGFNNNVTLTYS